MIADSRQAFLHSALTFDPVLARNRNDAQPGYGLRRRGYSSRSCEPPQSWLAFPVAAIFVAFLFVWSFACLDATAAESQAKPDLKRVMVLHSFGRDFKPWSDYATSIRSELARQSQWPIDIIDQSLVTARSNVDDSEKA